MHLFCLLVCLTFSGLLTYGQQMNSKRIEKASFSEIESELYLKPYHLDSIEKWAIYKAQLDISKGKRIMLYQQAGTENACILCNKYQEGFQLIRFGSADLPIPEIDAFVSAYNEKQIGPAVVQAEFSGITLQAEKIKASQQVVNDSMVRIQLNYPELENFFGLHMQEVQIEFQFLQPIQLPIKEINYQTLKNNGILIKNKGLKDLYLRVVFDFQKVGQLQEKCWCSVLEQRQYVEINLPLLRN